MDISNIKRCCVVNDIPNCKTQVHPASIFLPLPGRNRIQAE